MSRVDIPSWTGAGVLPPLDTKSPTGPQRSPYRVSLVDVVLRYGTSPERQRILQGFLELRRRLHSAGIIGGFQWIDGSFLEDVELIDGRPPRDLDVVTFLEPLAEQRSLDQHRELLDHAGIKRRYFVDHYFVELNLPYRLLVAQATYWYGLWSHRRDHYWKGFLQLDLNASEDEAAAVNLALLRTD